MNKEFFMKFAKSLAFAAISLACASAAMAQMPAGVYGEVGYTAATYNSPGFNVNPSAVRAIFGKSLDKNFNVEGMVAFGVANSSANVNGFDVAVNIDNMYGLYLKPKYELNHDVELFGRFGFAHIGATASTMGVAVTDSVDGFSYGAGANYKINSKYSLNVDYMSYGVKDGGNYNGLTFGLGYKY